MCLFENISHLRLHKRDFKQLLVSGCKYGYGGDVKLTIRYNIINYLYKRYET